MEAAANVSAMDGLGDWALQETGGGLPKWIDAAREYLQMIPDAIRVSRMYDPVRFADGWRPSVGSQSVFFAHAYSFGQWVGCPMLNNPCVSETEHGRSRCRAALL